MHKVVGIIRCGMADCVFAALADHPALAGQIESYAEDHREIIELCRPILVVEGGESYKTKPAVIDTIMKRIQDCHLCRH